ncbi:MAG: hypothetical protein AAF655_18515 [Bacteroidota bacterium]
MLKSLITTVSLVFISVSIIAQTDEINISASFAQSIELRISGNSSISFTFSTLSDYKVGKVGNASFEVASSTSFEVSASFTPFTNENGDQLDLINLAYCIAVEDGRAGEAGIRWNFGTPDYPMFDLTSNANWSHTYTGVFVASQTEKTILTPGSSGNAGEFEENRFLIQIRLGTINDHADMGGRLSLLDQNIPPGIYTCTMTLTAIPSIT